MDLLYDMILLDDFLDLFPRKNSPTFNEFLKNANVILYNGVKMNLHQYITKRNIDMDDVELLYQHILHRDKYLTSFYNVSLKIPDSMAINDAPMKRGHLDNNQLVKYKNVIRNMFFTEILKNTKSGLGFPTFLDVLENLYNKECIDVKLMTPSALFYLKEGRIGSVFSSFYFRASIMNPYLVYSLNRSVLKGTRIFTPTLGWGSYFYGFAESGMISRYVGVDVIPVVCNRLRSFAKKQYPSIDTEFICCPSEDLLHDHSFVKRNRGMFDVVFFSPPYFKMELYQGRQQSTSKYPRYEDWLRNYWEQTIQLCHHLLERNGTLCYILSGYGTKENEHDLLRDMNTITKQYFHYKGQQPMFNKNANMTHHKETAEKILFFSK